MAFSKHNERLMTLWLIPLAVALLFILKVFLFSNCFAFDDNDDANHTFVNLQIAHNIMRDGELPLMNVYNNFGTPILGDLLTYPYAIQAWIYGFLPGHLAMTVNRFMLAFLTMIFLTLHFRSLMSAWSASVCAILTLWTPIYVWCFAHHHYQAAMLFFAIILFLQYRLCRYWHVRDLFFLYLALVLLILSTNMQGVLLFVPIFLVNHFFINQNRSRTMFWITLLLVLAAFSFSMPDTVAFLRSVPQSARVLQDYDAAVHYTPRLLLAGVLGQFDTFYNGYYVTLYFSIVVLVMAGLGIGYLISDKNRKTVTQLILLGVFPVAGVLILLLFKPIWWSIPLLRSMDIKRIWWISNIFLMTSVGIALDSVWKRQLGIRSAMLALIIGTMTVLAGYAFFEWNQLRDAYTFPVFIFLAALWVYVGYRALWKGDGPAKGPAWANRIPAMISVVIGGCLVAVHYPSFAGITGLRAMAGCSATHHYSLLERAGFPHPLLLANKAGVPVMKPYSRFATNLPSGTGVEFRAAPHRILGSSGRSVLLNRKFTERLLADGLIEIDDNPLAYHFTRPWDPDKLADYGIRYVMNRIQFGYALEPMRRQGWNLEDSVDNMTVWKNPVPVSLAYLLQGERRMVIADDNIRLQGNAIDITLPPIDTEVDLVATFHSLDGWRARVNSHDQKILSHEGDLLRLHVTPEDRRIEFRYEPFTPWHFALWVLISLGFLGAAFVIFRKQSTVIVMQAGG